MGMVLACAFRKAFLQGSQAITIDKEHLNFIQREPRDPVRGEKGEAQGDAAEWSWGRCRNGD